MNDRDTSFGNGCHVFSTTLGNNHSVRIKTVQSRHRLPFNVAAFLPEVGIVAHSVHVRQRHQHFTPFRAALDIRLIRSRQLIVSGAQRPHPGNANPRRF